MGVEYVYVGIVIMMKTERQIDLIKGTIYGQAIGDALGLGTEFMTDEDMARNYPNGITHYCDIFQDRHRKTSQRVLNMAR